MLDKQLTKFLVLFYVLSCTYSVIVAFSQKLIQEPFDFDFLKELLFAYFFVYGTKFIFIFFSLILTKKFILDKIKIVPSIFLHLLICIIISWTTTALLVPFEKFIYGSERADMVINFKTIFDRFVYRSDFNFFIYFSLTTFLYAFYYSQKQKKQELEHSLLKNLLLDSKIKSLQSQIQPHFLFNTMNGISSLIEIDAKRAQDAISDLSTLLRNTLNLNDKKFHTLEEELNFLQSYINIERIRFEEKLIITTEVDTKLINEPIPPLMLQPIIENTIKHGFSYDHDTLKVSLNIKEIKGSIVFVIENNGSLLTDKPIIYGNGLRNVVERLAAVYDTNYSFKIENTPEKTVSVVLEIPLKISKLTDITIN